MARVVAAPVASPLLRSAAAHVGQRSSIAARIKHRAVALRVAERDLIVVFGGLVRARRLSSRVADCARQSDLKRLRDEPVVAFDVANAAWLPLVVRASPSTLAALGRDALLLASPTASLLFVDAKRGVVAPVTARLLR